MKPKRDEPLEEIWAIRRQITKEFNCDPKKLGEYYRRAQKKAGAKLYKRETHLHTSK